ncbi:unnamed protein product [Natator depressus]
MRNVNWTNLKENCIHSEYPVKRGLCFTLTELSHILLFIFGICFLPAWAKPKGISDYSGNYRDLERASLLEENDWRRACNNTDNNILDAGTAHPYLKISWDRKTFAHEAQPQRLSPNPERFDLIVCVLGSEGFSSGKHYWEVDVGTSTDWDLGGARKSTQRKGKLSFSTREGFWIMGLCGSNYWAKTAPWTAVMVQEKPKKIGVYLSCQQGQVTFFSVTDGTPVLTFNDCSFSGKFYPFFRNSHKETTMRICS